ncbi:MAG: TonB-dependent receptor [Bacteroidales bacterium]|jgi:TonB-linked SusC/RagA family outer membrane protein|nr:TonB-dependent receptor [Bacteroidales bacterium]
MKISILLLTVGIFSLSASVYSQDARISIRIQDESINDVLATIKAQTSYSFWFDVNDVDVEQRVSLNISDETVKSVLSQTLKDQDVDFAMYGNHIIIAKKGTFGSLAASQGITVTGTVTDNAGEPMPGVNVVVQGTTTGVVTGSDGKYSISVPDKNAVILFSFIGYSSQETTVGDRTLINVSMVEDTREIEEVVVVGYGVQKKETLTGAVSKISSKDLTVAPVANTTNALAGRLPGLTVIQQSGQPGSDGSSLNIRGFDSPLVIVDGVEAAFHTIDPNMIESISVLKDGSASIYGSRAGNGVILVTTKRGVQQKPVFTFTTNLTLQGITSMPKPTSAGQYAELEREKWIQSGKPEEQAPFTEEQIRKYYDGSDPQYPNTDWYGELVRNWTPQQQYNLSVRGGSENVKYYGFIGYLNQQSMWKNNGGHYDRYNMQSNIDASINKNLSFLLDLAAIVESKIFPVRPQSAGGDNVWQDFWNTLPVYPAHLPDPSLVSYADGGGTGGAHVTSNYELMGYNKWDNQNFKGTGTLLYKVPGVTGLSAKLLVNAIVNYNKVSVFSKPVKYYTYDIASETYTLRGALGNMAQLNTTQNRNLSITTQASLNYDRTFAGAHHITALALFEGIDYRSDWFSASRDNFLSPAVEQMYAGDNSTAKNNGSASEDGRMSFVGRVNYDYKSKYMFEATIRADASARFSPTKRWGYFPSVSAAWRLSEDDFMQGADYLDNLKIRANYGRSGNDNVVSFQYLSGYMLQGFAGSLIGDNPMKAIYSSVIPNPNLSWEEIEISNAGIDFSFLNKKLYGEADVFYRKRTGIPASRITTFPSTFGASLPQENINSLDNRGFELMLGTRFHISDFMFDISGNVAWSRDKYIHYEEPEYTDPDEIRMNKASGNWTDRLFGYRSDKLFGSPGEIDALTFQQDNNNNTTLRPGDVRYININDDDRLDWRDQVELGARWPHWTTGFNINASYKNFDLTALFQGAFGYYTDTWLLRSIRVYSEEVYNLRWTEKDNNTDALVPRMGGSGLNGEASDYRYKKAGYLRLKNASLGYNIPRELLSKIFVESARIYVSGYNLLTFDKLKKYHIDPEAPFGNAGYYYPQQRTINIGLNVSF